MPRTVIALNQKVHSEFLIDGIVAIFYFAGESFGLQLGNQGSRD
jgi:hypothetical protein